MCDKRVCGAREIGQYIQVGMKEHNRSNMNVLIMIIRISMWHIVA